MPIPLTCSCGRSFRLKDALAGKKIRCPECSTVLAVPRADESEDAEMSALALLNEGPQPEERGYVLEKQPPPAPRMPAEPSKPKNSVSSVAKAKPTAKKEAKKSSGVPRVAFEEGWFGSVNSGVIGGVLMMLIAVVWFVLGLWAGRIFFYPPILLVVGFISMMKGFLGRE